MGGTRPAPRRTARPYLELLEDRSLPAPLSGALPAPVVSLQYNNVNATPAITNAFVTDLYQGVLFRAPTASELSSVGGALNGGGLSGGGAFASLVKTSEYQNVVAPVQSLFDVYLGRGADMSGLGFYVNQLRSGTPLSQIALSIVQSPESQKVNGNVAGLSNADFVTFLYKKSFNRAPDATGNTFWVNALNSGSQTRGTEIVAFLQASEFNAAQPLVAAQNAVDSAYVGLWNADPDAGFSGYVSNVASGAITDPGALGTQFIAGTPYIGLGAVRNYVVGMYEGFLKRDPEASGYEYWRNQLTGSSLADVNFFATIVNSAEYQATKPTAQSTATLAYQTLLGRAPTTDELNAAVGLLSQGNATGLASLLLSSNDFTQNGYNQNIQHTVVIYEENWSFDGLYGSFPGANGLSNAAAAGTIPQTNDATGQPLTALPQALNPAGGANTPNQSNALISGPTGLSLDPRFPSSLPVQPYDFSQYDPQTTPEQFPPTPPDATGDIIHAYYHEQLQIDNGVLEPSNGKNDKYTTWSTNPGLTLSTFNATPLPEGQIAQQYVMDDNFFHSAYGGSYLNHQFLVASAAPLWNQPIPNSTLNNKNVNTFLSSFSTVNGVKTLNDSNLTIPGQFGLDEFNVNTTFGADAPHPSTTSKVTAETETNAGGSATVAYKLNHGNLITPTAASGSISQGSTKVYNFTVNADGTLTLTPVGTPADTISSGSLNLTTGTLTLNWATNPGASSISINYTYSTADQLLAPINDNNPNAPGYEQNIGDELSAKGISWNWDSGGWTQALQGNPDADFQFHHQPFAYFANYAPMNADGSQNPQTSSLLNPNAHLQDEQVFSTDVAADNKSLTTKNLGAVTFIKPIGENNEHPGYADILSGQQHEMQLINTLQNSIDWSNSNIVTTYDENGGRWDQVNPPMIDSWGVGTRVPGVEISPYARRGFVDHTQLETDSILTTIEQQYGLKSLGTHDAKANTLLSAYDFAPSDLLKNNSGGAKPMPIANGTAGTTVKSSVATTGDPAAPQPTAAPGTATVTPQVVPGVAIATAQPATVPGTTAVVTPQTPTAGNQGGQSGTSDANSGTTPTAAPQSMARMDLGGGTSDAGDTTDTADTTTEQVAERI